MYSTVYMQVFILSIQYRWFRNTKSQKSDILSLSLDPIADMNNVVLGLFVLCIKIDNFPIGIEIYASIASRKYKSSVLIDWLNQYNSNAWY